MKKPEQQAEILKNTNFLLPTFARNGVDRAYAGILGETGSPTHVLTFFKDATIAQLDNVHTRVEARSQQAKAETPMIISTYVNDKERGTDQVNWKVLLANTGARNVRYLQIYPPLPGDQ